MRASARYAARQPRAPVTPGRAWASRPRSYAGGCAVARSRPGQGAVVNHVTDAPVRRRRWLVWVLAGAVGVIAGGTAVYAANRDDPAPAAAVAGSDGPFAVTVTSARCGLKEVGPEGLRQPAKGQYCLVGVDVRNTGTEPALLDGGAQEAVDSAGARHGLADQASVFLNDGSPSLLDEIAPGSAVSGILPFDIPAGSSLSALVVHGSMGSRGTSVPLSFRK
jgi:hypothetical protein